MIHENTKCTVPIVICQLDPFMEGTETVSALISITVVTVQELQFLHGKVY